MFGSVLNAGKFPNTSQTWKDTLKQITLKGCSLNVVSVQKYSNQGEVCETTSATFIKRNMAPPHFSSKSDSSLFLYVSEQIKTFFATSAEFKWKTFLENPYFCCCLFYSNPYLLSEHVLDLDLDEKIERRMNRIVGGNGEGVFYCCGVCSRTYKDKTKMRHHIETHLDSYHSCPICQQQYKTRRTLKTHIARSHQNSTSAFGSQLLEVEMPDEVAE